MQGLRNREFAGKRCSWPMALVPAIIWVVLFGGAFLTVGFTFFFGAENLRAQSLMTGALSILIFAGLLTVVEIGHPFAGTVKVGPEALAAVVKDFAGGPPPKSVPHTGWGAAISEPMAKYGASGACWKAGKRKRRVMRGNVRAKPRLTPGRSIFRNMRCCARR